MIVCMTLKDMKMDARARAAANKDSKEGMADQDSKEGYQQEGVVDQDSLKFYFNCFFVHIAITPIIVVLIILLVLLHIIMFGIVVAMPIIIISSSVCSTGTVCFCYCEHNYCCSCCHCCYLKYACVTIMSKYLNSHRLSIFVSGITRYSHTWIVWIYMCQSRVNLHGIFYVQFHVNPVERNVNHQ